MLMSCVFELPGLIWESKELNCSNRDPGIASVLEKPGDVSAGLGNDVPCAFCEMAVIWAQNQLRKNKTEAQIKAYMNKVTISSRKLIEDCFVSFLLVCRIFLEGQKGLVVHFLLLHLSDNGWVIRNWNLHIDWIVSCCSFASVCPVQMASPWWIAILYQQCRLLVSPLLARISSSLPSRYASNVSLTLE